MAKRRKGKPIHGWVNLNKPKDIGSTQALAIVRRGLNAQKAGHGGTLDPLADGILPIALGEATKTVNYAQDASKTYEFTVTWGQQRSTDDAEGEVIATSDIIPTEEQIQAILPHFIGEIEQVPPQFSAIKVNGERAYDIARDGEKVELKSRKVQVYDLKLCHPEQSEGSHNAEGDPSTTPQDDKNTTTFICDCGKGTYIRSLGRDIALKLSTVGYISSLTRTRVGPFTIDDAISLDYFREIGDKTPETHVVLPLESVLDDIPVLPLRENEASRITNGNAISFIARPDMERLKEIGILPGDIHTALATFKGTPLAIIEVDGPDIRVLRGLNINS